MSDDDTPTDDRHATPAEDATWAQLAAEAHNDILQASDVKALGPVTEGSPGAYAARRAWWDGQNGPESGLIVARDEPTAGEGVWYEGRTWYPYAVSGCYGSCTSSCERHGEEWADRTDLHGGPDLEDDADPDDLSGRMAVWRDQAQGAHDHVLSEVDSALDLLDQEDDDQDFGWAVTGDTTAAMETVATLRAYLTARYVHEMGRTEPGSNVGHPYDTLRTAGETMETVMDHLDKAVAAAQDGPKGPHPSRAEAHLESAHAALSSKTVREALEV